MKEKNIKFIMELIFIFILPLLFILPNVSINNNYVYDNDGNFEISSKELEYDSIVYNQYYKNYFDFNNYATYQNNEFDISGSTYAYSTYPTILNYEHVYYVSFDVYYYDDNVCSNMRFKLGNMAYASFVIAVSPNDSSNHYDKISTLVIDGNNTNVYGVINYTNNYLHVSINNLYIIDLTKMFGSGYEPSNIEELSNYLDFSVYHDYIESDIIEYNSDNIISINNNLVQSPFIYIKNLISGFLLIDSNNITFNIVIDYTSIWFLMFVIWHLVYCLFDFIIHLIRIKKKE